MFLQAILVALLAERAFAAAGGYIQTAGPGNASFTMYSGCQQPACGVAATGFTAAMHQLAFGSVPGIGPGDACGRCFSITGNRDPFSPAYTGPFGQTIVVKVTDMCPVAGNEQWCGQTVQNQVNQFGMPAHFDLCVDNGAAAVFFPSGHGALTGTWQEVSCSLWSGTDKSPSFNGACILGENAGLWPAVGCGNQGLAPGASGTPASTSSKPPTGTTSPSGPSTTTSAPAGSQTQWGQCGGTGWLGPTVCAPPTSCIPISPPFYSQCL